MKLLAFRIIRINLQEEVSRNEVINSVSKCGLAAEKTQPGTLF